MRDFTMSQFVSKNDLIAAMQARIDELESALHEVVEFHSPSAWGSEDNKRDALNNAISVLEK